MLVPTKNNKILDNSPYLKILTISTNFSFEITDLESILQK